MLPQVTYSEFFLWLLGRRKRFKVTGRSMLPTLQPGEEILLNPYAYRKSLPRVDEIAVLAHPYYPDTIVVKRIVALDRDGRCFLLGDNQPESTDSRHWGGINYQDLLGRATSIFT